MTTTSADREKELRFLLDQMSAYPERDWSEARQRVRVLQAMDIGANKDLNRSDA